MCVLPSVSVMYFFAAFKLIYNIKTNMDIRASMHFVVERETESQTKQVTGNAEVAVRQRAGSRMNESNSCWRGRKKRKFEVLVPLPRYSALRMFSLS